MDNFKDWQAALLDPYRVEDPQDWFYCDDKDLLQGRVAEKCQIEDESCQR